MKNNMTKKEFSTEIKDRVRKIEDKMNIKSQSFFAVFQDGMMDQTTLDNAISELYEFYQDEEEYLVLRSEIYLGSQDSWIEIDFVQASKDNGRWSVKSLVVLYTDDGSEETVLADF